MRYRACLGLLAQFCHYDTDDIEPGGGPYKGSDSQRGPHHRGRQPQEGIGRVLGNVANSVAHNAARDVYIANMHDAD